MILGYLPIVHANSNYYREYKYVRQYALGFFCEAKTVINEKKSYHQQMGYKIEKGTLRPCFRLVLNQGIVHWHNSTTFAIFKKIHVMQYLLTNQVEIYCT